MINLRGVLNGTAISRIDHFYGEMVREHHGMANIARMNITRRSCDRLYDSTKSQICSRLPYRNTVIIQQVIIIYYPTYFLGLSPRPDVRTRTQSSHLANFSTWLR